MSVSDAPPAARPALADRLTTAALWLAALVSAALVYAEYLEDYRSRWDSLTHDRNAHYAFGVGLGVSARTGDLGQVVKEFDAGSRVWPPLHGVLLGVLVAVAGPDVRLSVLPSLAGWVLTVVAGGLLARRLAPAAGNAAALAFAAFALAAPALRAYAADVMLESLGAGLTCVALWAYVRWAQGAGRIVPLAAVLTALFLHKYNYYLIPAAAIAAAELAVRWPGVRLILGEVPWRPWLAAQPRRPLNYVLALIGVVAAAAWVTGGFAVEFRGRRVPVRAFELVNYAYPVLFLRLAGWWRQPGRAWVRARFGSDGDRFFLWHLWPAAVWLLMPQRAGKFLWFVSPANAGEESSRSSAAALREYLDYAATDYHASTTAAYVALALAAFGLLAVAAGRLRAGALAVGLCVVLAAVLTVNHPNVKPRFLHSWMPVTWALAGAGLAMIVGSISRPRWLPAVGGTAGLIALAGLMAAGFDGPGRATGLPIGARRPSVRELTDVYAGDLREASAPAVLSNVPAHKFVARWGYLEATGRSRGPVIDLREVGQYGTATADGFRRWVERTRCDTLIYVDVPEGSPLNPAGVGGDDQRAVRGVLPEQDKFRLVRQIEIPPHGWVVTVWKK